MKFIKLSSLMINTNYINKIIFKPNKYHIYVSNFNIDGMMLFSASSVVTLNNDEYEICAINTQMIIKGLLNG